MDLLDFMKDFLSDLTLIIIEWSKIILFVAVAKRKVNCYFTTNRIKKLPKTAMFSFHSRESESIFIQS